MFWSKLSIVQKLSLSLILLSVLPLLLVGGTSYFFSAAALRSQASHLATTILEKQTEVLSLQLEQVESLTSHIAGNEFIHEALMMSPTSRDSFDILAINARIGYILNQFLNVKGLVSIDLLGVGDTYFHVGDTLQVSEACSKVKKQLFESAQTSSSAVSWPGIQENINTSASEELVLPAIRLLRQVDRQTLKFKPEGLIVANISLNYIYDTLSTVDIGSGGFLMVIDGSGKTIYHPDKSLIGESYSLPVPLEKLSEVKSSTVALVNGQEMVLNHIYFQHAGWHILSLVPSKTIAAQTDGIGSLTLLMTVLSLVFIVVVGFYVTKMVVRPIQDIINSFKKYERGELDLNHQLTPRGKDEIAQLVQWYNTFITTLKFRQQTEQERERLLQAINQSNETIVITDKEGTIQYVNPAFTKNSGYSSEEAIGQNPRILKSDQHNVVDYEEMWETLTQGHAWYGCLVNKKKNGSLYSEQVTISPVKDTQGQIVNYVAVKRDITEEIAREEQRVELEQQLSQKHKMEAVGYMAGGMAHNFNNNLAIILGNVELSQIKLPETSEIIPLLENAKIAIRNSRDLVLKIITYSRKGIQHKTSIHLSDVIHETIALLQSTLPTTINLQQEINPESCSNVIHADPSQIQEILINLYNNAVHAMKEQGDLKILLDSVELTAKDIPAQYEAIPGSYAKLSIQDTGCGIPTELLNNIFDPFFSTKEEYEGAGMGLATVQGIVAQHGGVIRVNSIPDQGTVFDLYFPIVDADLTDPATVNTELPRGTELILLVDDDEMLASLCGKLLTQMGYQVSIMTDSAEALKLFAANADRFDLVITDQTMPDLTGKDLIQKIKKIRTDIPTILCTGFSNQVNEEGAKGLGIDAFLMKPLDLPELSQTVRRVLDGDKEK